MFNASGRRIPEATLATIEREEDDREAALARVQLRHLHLSALVEKLSAKLKCVPCRGRSRTLRGAVASEAHRRRVSTLPLLLLLLLLLLLFVARIDGCSCCRVKEEVAEGLAMVDFEQLKIENR